MFSLLTRLLGPTKEQQQTTRRLAAKVVKPVDTAVVLAMARYRMNAAEAAAIHANHSRPTNTELYQYTDSIKAYIKAEKAHKLAIAAKEAAAVAAQERLAAAQERLAAAQARLAALRPKPSSTRKPKLSALKSSQTSGTRRASSQSPSTPRPTSAGSGTRRASSQSPRAKSASPKSASSRSASPSQTSTRNLSLALSAQRRNAALAALANRVQSGKTRAGNGTPARGVRQALGHQ